MTTRKPHDGQNPTAPSEERALARAELTRALGLARNAKERLDAMLSSPKAAELVPTLPAEEVFFTIKEVGLTDCLELVHLTSPGQFRAFVDLDAWKGERLDSAAALLWLRAARTDDDDERFARKFAALDVEIVALILKTTLKIWDLEEDEDPEPQGATFRSPEGKYLVEFLVEGGEHAGVRSMLEHFYAEDPLKAARLLEAVRFELPTELEETALRWRGGRMADLGFPDLQEALSYWAYLDPDAALPPLEKAPAVPGGFFLSRLPKSGRFFDQVAARISGEDREIVERQLATLFNAAMVVEGVDPGELEQVSKSLASARDTLSLGLEHASRGDPQEAAALLVSTPIKRLFQVGVSLGLRLKFRADRLMKAGGASFPGTRETPLLDAPLGELITALRRKRPQLTGLLDEPPGTPEVARPFRDRADVERAAVALARAERVVDLMKALGFDAAKVAQRLDEAGVGPESRRSLRFSDLALTAAARAALAAGFEFAPIREADLPRLCQLALGPAGAPVAAVTPEFAAALREPLEQAAQALGEPHLAEAGVFGHLCLERLRLELGGPWSSSGAIPPEIPLPVIAVPGL